MKLIRFIFKAVATWSLLLFLLGVAFAANPHAAENLLGLLVFGLIAGGLLSGLFGHSSAPAGDQSPQQPLVEAALAVVEPAAPPIPGARGARIALDQHPAGGTRPDSLAVCFRGQIKAYVTRDSWHPVGDFAELGAEDPEYRLVALMSVYAQNVLLRSEGVYTEEDAIAYALGGLVPHELLERDIPNPAHTAAALCLPPDVLTAQNLHALRAAITERNNDEVNTHDLGTRPSELSAHSYQPPAGGDRISFACGRTGAARVRRLPAQRRGPARNAAPGMFMSLAASAAGSIVAWRWTAASFRSPSRSTASLSRASRT
jgi:hypothetical protein